MERRFLKYFFLFFLLSFLIFNWGKISWLFNYKVLFQVLPKPVEETKVIEGPPVPAVKKAVKKCEHSEKEDSIEIPKLGISAPLRFVQNENEVNSALDSGVVHFPDSALPGEIGEIIILGHSAPPGWPKIKYDWVFSQIQDLGAGDLIILNFKKCEFSFKVSDKKILLRGGEIPEDWKVDGESTLVLISCWPPGKDIKRIAVMAEPLENP